MYVIAAKNIPEKILEQPLIKSAQVHNACGRLIDIAAIKFSNLTTSSPSPELMRYNTVNVILQNNGFAEQDLLHAQSDDLGIVNADSLTKAQAEILYQEGQKAVDLYKKSAAENKCRAKIEFVQSAGVSFATIILGAFSVNSGLKYGERSNCISSDGRVLTIQECKSSEFQKMKDHTKHTGIISGLEAICLAAVAIISAKKAFGYAARSKEELTKAVLAMGNSNICEERLIDAIKTTSHEPS